MNNIDRYDAYIQTHIKEKDLLITQMEQYAEEYRIPIMESVGIESLIGLLRIQKPKQILEIGSAIGYSAIRIATALTETNVLTIERDVERYAKAVENIAESGLTKRIQIIEADALEIDLDKAYIETFDALFIDAAKGQYQRFFEKYTPFLNSNGVIYCDNIFMHGMVLREDADVPKRSRTMIRKLKEFTRWVMSHPEYDSVLLPIGDGLLIATKKQEIL
ncbi:O-methyltransferase [Sporosarcina siberiensis]|uniref:tRNA 5-hydroxyuridine methyltransferase n=1 Tax=Sporosarcina siberiensis TaxID=1365606 RepID=A0ABW4SCZ6_9BACL